MHPTKDQNSSIFTRISPPWSTTRVAKFVVDQLPKTIASSRQSTNSTMQNVIIERSVWVYKSVEKLRQETQELRIGETEANVMVICRITGHAGPLTKVRNFVRELAAEQSPRGVDASARMSSRLSVSATAGSPRPCPGNGHGQSVSSVRQRHVRSRERVHEQSQTPDSPHPRSRSQHGQAKERQRTGHGISAGSPRTVRDRKLSVAAVSPRAGNGKSAIAHCPCPFHQLAGTWSRLILTLSTASAYTVRQAVSECIAQCPWPVQPLVSTTYPLPRSKYPHLPNARENRPGHCLAGRENSRILRVGSFPQPRASRASVPPGVSSPRQGPALRISRVDLDLAEDSVTTPTLPLTGQHHSCSRYTPDKWHWRKMRP